MRLLAICFLLASCQMRQPDVLDDLGREVLKTKEGLNIEIKPEKNP